MKNKKILTLIGGISRNSLNRKFYQGLKTLESDLEFDEFQISKLPYYSQDIENDPPDIVTEFKEKIRETDAVLLITPEYNRSFPGVLKNAIDWGSRPYGQNLWSKKPTAIKGASPGKIGTFGAQHHLRQVCAYLDMYVMGQPEFYFQAVDAFREDGTFASESSEKFAQTFLHSFAEFIDIFTVQHTFSYQKEQVTHRLS